MGSPGAKRNRRSSRANGKLAEALKLVSKGRWTIRHAADFAGLTYRQILDEMSKRGIDSGPKLEDLREGERVQALVRNESLRRKAPKDWDSARAIREERNRRR